MLAQVSRQPTGLEQLPRTPTTREPRPVVRPTTALLAMHSRPSALLQTLHRVLLPKPKVDHNRLLQFAS